jgi:hypothetical protein
MKEGLQDDRMLSDVNFESVRGPMIDALNQIVQNTSESEGWGTSRMEGMTADRCAEVGLEMRDKPRCGPAEVSQRSG